MQQKINAPVHIAMDHPVDGKMTLFWEDGSAQVFVLTALRKACPCASCRELRQQVAGGDGLSLLTNNAIDPSTELIDISPVGRYALQLTWKDGHNTGLFTYEFLRELGTPVE